MATFVEQYVQKYDDYVSISDNIDVAERAALL